MLCAPPEDAGEPLAEGDPEQAFLEVFYGAESPEEEGPERST